MEELSKLTNQYGIAVAILLFLVGFLGKYAFGTDKKKDERIQKLEDRVDKLMEEVSTLKDKQNDKALELNTKYVEMAHKMLDVIERNTEEFQKSTKVQESLQSYLTHFINKQIKN